MKEIPIVDIAGFLKGQPSPEECKQVAYALEEYGTLIIRDPRVSEEQNARFLDMMEQYYGQPEEVKAKDMRPEIHYQLGVTPEYTEKARDHRALIEREIPKDALPHIPTGPDAKCRFFWRIGERPAQTAFAELNAPAVIPAAFPQWSDVMNGWGSSMMNAIHAVAEMAALGFGLQQDTFTSMMKNGPHLLAPTGSDLDKHGTKGTIFAGFHYDLNFLTIHGKARFPGLYIWTRGWKKLPVRVPEGHLLIQAGKQLEWLTGGRVGAGFHEVVVDDRTIEFANKAREAGRSIWRVSSTLFSHIASDQTLQPLPQFATPEKQEKYPPTKAGDQVLEELKAIDLALGA